MLKLAKALGELWEYIPYRRVHRRVDALFVTPLTSGGWVCRRGSISRDRAGLTYWGPAGSVKCKALRDPQVQKIGVFPTEEAAKNWADAHLPLDWEERS